MKIAFVIPGGVDRSGRDRVVPMFLWLIERIASRHELHVFVLDYYEHPVTYPLLGAVVHDLGRTTAPPARTTVILAVRNALRVVIARRMRFHGRQPLGDLGRAPCSAE